MSQNLVKNPSFELFINCPKHFGNVDKDLKDWSMPTQGSADYFNSCSFNPSVGMPINFMGEQDTKFGEAYVGIYLYAPDDYREYIQGQLYKPLQKNIKYTLSFYINLADNSDYAIHEIDVLLSSKPIEVNIKKELSSWQLSKIQDNSFTNIKISGNNYFISKDTWMKVTTTFLANGDEQFITIGNLKNNAATRRKKVGKMKKGKGAYYFIEKLYLGEGIQDYALDEVHIFENVLFKFDEFYIDKKGEQDLIRVFNYLQSDPTLKIVINGFTDNFGNSSYNKVLSLKRATAVANKLMAFGLERKRITWNGFGDRQPIENNEDKAGRVQNRRVEFVISKTPER